MKKVLRDLCVGAVSFPNASHVLLHLVSDEALPPIVPGQFVEVQCPTSGQTMLRRPISIHYTDPAASAIGLLIHCVGEGTRALAHLRQGNRLSCLFPLGNGFTLPSGQKRCLLVGGGVGSAPLLQLGCELHALGHSVTFLLGGKTADDLLRTDAYRPYGRLCLTTEDGSVGTKGFVTHHDVIGEPFDLIQTCGPRPMMQAVSRMARDRGIRCEVSLENLMACGMGACLCCVENTSQGHRCVCTDGPVFDSRDLLWT